MKYGIRRLESNIESQVLMEGNIVIVTIYQISSSQLLASTVHYIILYLGLAAIMLVVGALLIPEYIKLKRTKNKDYTAGPSIKRLNQRATLLIIICLVLMAILFIFFSISDIKDYSNLKYGHFSTYTGTLTNIVRFSGEISNEVPLNNVINISDGVYRIVIPQDVILKIETDNYIPFKSNTKYEINYLPDSGYVVKIIQFNSN